MKRCECGHGLKHIKNNKNVTFTIAIALTTVAMEQCTLKNVNNCLNTNIYSYLETSGGHSYNL
jgi:hypothetical protein